MDTPLGGGARQRGLRPAIVAAVCDRFRPVLLTTATTVLGLAPLLYERSSQALFLKPTVVTLAGIRILVRFGQKANAELPMLLTPLEIVTLRRPEQLLNAEESMLTMPSAIVT